MKYNFPKIEINTDQKLWLEALYDRFKKGEIYVDPRDLKAHLRGKIPVEFKPMEINWRLSPGGRSLTVVGLWYTNPEDNNIVLLDHLLKGIQDFVIKNPLTDKIPLSNISIDGLDSDRVKDSLLKMVKDFVSNEWYTIESKDAQGNSFIEIQLGGENGFDFFNQYSNLEDYVGKQFDKLEKTKTQPQQIENYDLKVIPNTAFILMWMGDEMPELDDTYNAIKRVCELFDIKAYRVDDTEPKGQITDAILDNIKKAQYIIADLTGIRPNVYYEIGYAQALGKSPVLLKKKGTDVHFDLSVHKVTEYLGVTDLEEKLSKRFEIKLEREPRKKI
jgi:hypothetical protein